jgi:hypothetical protein
VEGQVVTASLSDRELSALRLMKNGAELVYCSREGILLIFVLAERNTSD